MVPDNNIEVAYSHMLACIAAQLEISAHQDMKRLEARLKQLRSKAQIPPPATRNLGPNARYAFSELWKLTVIFAAVDSSVDTLRAAIMVKTYWTDIFSGMAEAWLSRESHSTDPVFLQMFSGVIDGFTKYDDVQDWIDLEAKRQATGAPLPLVSIGRMSILFSSKTAGRLPPKTKYRSRTACTLINVSTLVHKSGSTLVDMGQFSAPELDDYFLSVKKALGSLVE